MKLDKKYFFYSIILIVFLLFLPFLVNPNNKSFYLNQFEIQKNELNFRTANSGIFFDYWKSGYSLFLHNLFSLRKNGIIDFEKPETVLAYVFERFPSYAIIYPTETYYYYQFWAYNGTSTEKINISGNIRALDFNKGIMHLGYFIKSDQHGAVGFKSFSKEDGVDIKKSGDFLYDVTYNNRTIRFKVNDIFDKQVKASLNILPSEEFVAHIQDESGIKFFLYYNNDKKTFYDILDDENGISEKVSEIHKNIFVGERTGFVYYNDQDFDRRILIGVSGDNIFKNNYFDGPFDQVPPYLLIKSKLEEAYPYVKFDKGIDQYGNFLGFQSGSRVAISPYTDYLSAEEIIAVVENCEKDNKGENLWSCLTYESKKDFHKTETFKNAVKGGGFDRGQSDNAEHYVFTSQGWPANHKGEVSQNWPANHKARESSVWPANHIGEISKIQN